MHAIAARQAQLTRAAGALAELPLFLNGLCLTTTWMGDFAGAASLSAEAESVAAATGSHFDPSATLKLAALRGREAEASVAIEQAAAGGHGLAASYAHWAAAVLYNGLARYEEATAAARNATSDTVFPWPSMWALPELIEAAARAGDAELAGRALERLTKTTQPFDTDVARGLEARCRALLCDDGAADDLYREAIDRLSHTRVRPDLARAHLLYGEWLRRERRRRDARKQLLTAYDLLETMGMEAFAERARRELMATGEKVRKRNVETREHLTPQEAQIARLARDGLSNPEIGARLFLSPRTVEWHLRNTLATAHLLAGELAAAERLVQEDRLIAEVTGNPPARYAAMMLAAWRGREPTASELIAATGRAATALSMGRLVTAASYAAAVLANGLGRHEVALDAARQAFERDQLGNGPFVLPELAEAAARTGDTALLGAAREWLSDRTRATRSEWVLGIEARVRAFQCQGDAAETLYVESIDRLRRSRVRLELARAHLLYGEWLRRRRRRLDAREQLRTAHQLLELMGVEAFAARARRELRATGEHAGSRTVETRGQLTAQEAMIARLARDGLSNPEIGSRLFISARTVQYHLHKVFAKLAISSRSQLDRALPADTTATEPKKPAGSPLAGSTGQWPMRARPSPDETRPAAGPGHRDGAGPPGGGSPS
jgi:DNA-binding NarL/FixJ family response regulator